MSTATDFATICEKFFSTWLPVDREASIRTIDAYAQCFRLLLRFCYERLGIAPSKLAFSAVDADLVTAFLDSLRTQRQNSRRTRNARCAAIRSFFSYCQLEYPQYSAQIQRVLAIPFVKAEKRDICYLTHEELRTILAAISRFDWRGRRNYAMLLLASSVGPRVSEFTGLRVRDIEFGRVSYVKFFGKGRKERTNPLPPEVARVVKAWIAGQGTDPNAILFPNSSGCKLSTDAVAGIITSLWKVAVKKCPSMGSKRITPHVLRHTAAMHWAEIGVDDATISALLGHDSMESTMIYVKPTMAMKRAALEKASIVSLEDVQFNPGDPLLRFLTALSSPSHGPKPPANLTSVA